MSVSKILNRFGNCSGQWGMGTEVKWNVIEGVRDSWSC